MKPAIALGWTCVVVIAVVSPARAEFMPEFRRAPETPVAKLPSPASGIDSPEAWAPRRAELLRHWQSVIGAFPSRVPLEAKVVSIETLDDHTRSLVRYRIDAETTAEAFVLVPKDGRVSRPGAVVLHPTSAETINVAAGLGGRETSHHALHLVRRGYVCVAPRNFLWTYPGKTYQQAGKALLAEGRWHTGMARMTWDAIRATDLLLEQPTVDSKRVVTIGHSLGGKEALYHAAFDERIRAAVSCEGGVGVSFSNWEAEWYLGAQAKSPKFRDHHELIALIAPRALLVIGGEASDGAKSWPYVEANLPVWRLFDATDRIGLFRHAHGHRFPPPGEERERVYRWLDHWSR